MTDRDAAVDAVMKLVEAYSWRRMSEASANDGAYEHSTLMERDRAAVRAAVEQYGREQRVDALTQAADVMRRNGCTDHAWIVANIEPIAELERRRGAQP